MTAVVEAVEMSAQSCAFFMKNCTTSIVSYEYES